MVLLIGGVGFTLTLEVLVFEGVFWWGYVNLFLKFDFKRIIEKQK
jgi:hypothetical protein